MGYLAPIIEFAKAVFIGYAGTSAAYAFAVNVARVGLLALSAKAFAPKPDLSVAAENKRVTFRDPIAPQTFTYGQDMVSGPIIFSNVAGNENRDLYMVIAIAGHEIDSVVSYRIDSTDIALADLSGTEDGLIQGGKFDGVGRVDLRKGTSTQTVVTNLSTPFSAQWTTAHRGRGWAYMVWELNLVEGSEDVFKTQPSNFRAVIKGKKVYDPRLDSTQVIDSSTSPDTFGSGAHRLADSTTWEWSDNPALCLADFIRDDKFGMREEDDRIDWEMVATAADICDELVEVPPAASPANTQKRYTFNSTFQSTQKRSAVRDEMLNAMLGRMVFSAGKWRIWAGAAVTPDVTLTEANLAGGVVVQASSPANERYNRVRGKFIDRNRDYVACSYVEQRSSTYESEDGGEVRELVADFGSTQNEYEAQRKAIATLKQSRQQRVVVFEGNYSCFRIQPGTTVLLSISELGFSGEKFFVSEWKFNQNGVELTLVEEIDSAWADPLVADYTERSPTGVLTFGETGVPAPTGLAATPITGGVRVTWTYPLRTVSHIEVWMAYENVRASATLVGTSNGTSFDDLSQDVSRLRYYWVRSVDALGRVSNYTPNLTTTTITAYPGAGDYIGRVVADGLIRLGSSYWTLSSTGATPPTYSVGTGTKGTDTIHFDSSDITLTARHKIRRGPDTWDVEAVQGQAIEVNLRAKYSGGATGLWTVTFVALVQTSDAADANVRSYSAGSILSFDETSTVDEWQETSFIVELTEEDLETSKPRYISLKVQVDGNNNGAEFDLDMLDANISGAVFKGTNTGYVPKAVPADAAKFLQGDGTWATPAGSGDVSASGTPANNQVAIWTDASTIEGDPKLTFDGAATLTVDDSVYVDSGDGNAHVYLRGFGRTNPSVILQDTSGNLVFRYDNSDGTKDLYCRASDGAWIFESNVQIDTDGVGPMLTLGDGTGNTGDELLKFNTDRSWSFFQKGDDASTDLELRSTTTGKALVITDGGNSNRTQFEFRVSTGGSQFKLWDATQVWSSVLYQTSTLTVLDSSTAIRMVPAAGTDLELYRNGSNLQFKVYASNGTDYISISHNGTDAQINATGSDIDVNQSLAVRAGAAGLKLYGTTDDHLYVSFYADSAAQTTRSAYMGFSSAGSELFQFVNEYAASQGFRFNDDVEVVGNVTFNVAYLNERASAAGNVTADGQLWVKSNAPNDLYFTTDNGLDYPVAYGRYRVTADTTLDNMNVTETLGAQHINGLWATDDGSAYTLTLEGISSTNFPVGSQLSIVNGGSGNPLTIQEDAGSPSATLYVLTGSAVTASGGSAQVTVGGYATLIRKSTSVYWLMGAGVNP